MYYLIETFFFNIYVLLRHRVLAQRVLFDIENEKKKVQKMRKKQCKNLERQENVRGKIKVTLVIKNKVEDEVQEWLVFLEKNLNKIANLDQKRCGKNKREVRERQHN